MMELREALRVEDACGRYVKAVALDHFTFSAYAGELCCLFGLHNAGKTTFMQMMSGRISGEWQMRALINGVRVDLGSPAASAAAGIRCVWSESSLIKGLTVAENLYVVGQMPLLMPYVRRSEYEERTRGALARYGITDMAPSKTVGCLSAVQCFLLELVRCILSGAKVLFLDCLSSFPHKADIVRLETLLRAFTADGGTAILLYNRPDEHMFFVDRFVVMRAGRRVKTFTRGDFNSALLQHYAEGETRKREEAPAPKGSTFSGAPICVCHLKLAGYSCSLKAMKGCLTGVLCPDEWYAEHLAELLAEGHPPADFFAFEGKEYTGRRLPASVRKRISIVKGLMPQQILLPNFDALGNLCLASVRLAGPVPRLRRRVSALLRQENRELLTMIDAAMAGGQAEPVLNMSLEARRILLLQSRLVILDRPMRGLDDGSSAKVIAELRRLAERGAAIVILDDRKDRLQSDCDKVVEWN